MRELKSLVLTAGGAAAAAVTIGAVDPISIELLALPVCFYSVESTALLAGTTGWYYWLVKLLPTAIEQSAESHKSGAAAAACTTKVRCCTINIEYVRLDSTRRDSTHSLTV